MSKLFSHKAISPSMLVAVVALVFACAGSAVAGSLITGSQIKDATITGKDVKNRSIGLADIGVNTRKALRGSGATGAAGAPGAKGDTGAAGAAGAPAVQSITGPGNGFTTNNALTTIDAAGVTFGPFVDNTHGTSLIYHGLDGLKLKDVADATYTASYEHTGPGDNGDAPYFRIFLNSNNDDIVFSPSTQPDGCYGGGGPSSPQCTSSGRLIKYEVHKGTVRYNDDAGNLPDVTWASAINDHGNDVISGVRVSLGNSLPGTESGKLNSLRLEAKGFGPTTFTFGH